MASHCAPASCPKDKRAPLAWAVVVAAAVSILFFTSFFRNAAGPWDAVRACLPYLHRAGGTALHNHPWTFYFERLLCYHFRGGPVWSEGLIVGLGAIGLAVALAGRVFLLRLIAFYTFWLTVIYTMIPYKTPWCLLTYYYGMIVLAGVGASWLWRAAASARWRVAMAVALGAGLAHLGWQDWLGNFGVDKSGLPYCDSAKNPYVYSPNAAGRTAVGGHG